MEYETFRNSRGAGSSPMYRSPAFCAGEIAGGSGCFSGFECFVGQSLETRLVARRCEGVVREASPGSGAEAVVTGTAAVSRCAEAGFAILGLCAGGMEWTSRAALDLAVVRPGISPRLRRHAAAPVGMESAETGATGSRAARSGDRSLAARHVAATKKRASNAKLAWFFSMKAASCCSPCGDECGPNVVTRRCSTPGIVTIESPPLRPSVALPGRVDSTCTTICGTITRMPWMSFNSCITCTIACGDRCCSCGTVFQRIARPHVNCVRRGATGCMWNGFPDTRRNSIPWKTSGINPNTATSPTAFPTTSANYTKRSTTSSKTIVTIPDNSTPSFKPHNSLCNTWVPLTI